MAFPTTPILDPANHAENPAVGPHSEWGATYVTSNDGTGAVKDDGTSLISVTDATWGTVPWEVDYPGDVECWGESGPGNVATATDYLLYARILNPGGVSVTGYGGFWSAGGNQWAIETLDAGNTETVQASGTLGKTTWAYGDLFGMRVEGVVTPKVSIYLLVPGQGTVMIGQWVDTRGTVYTHGYLGFGTPKGITGQGIVNFAGGPMPKPKLVFTSFPRPRLRH